MPKSNAQKLAQAKYDQKAYDQILIKVKKGKRDEYRTAAENLGLGQMEMIRAAIEEYIQNHTGGEFVPTTTAETLTAEDRRTLERLNSLPKSTRAKFTGLLADYAALVEKGGD